MEKEQIMKEALRLAQEAAAHGEIPVGCVITDSSGQIIGRGRNRREETHDATAHAEVEAIRDRMQTIFVLDDLETFKKNGRLKGIKALVATTMNIKPVLVSNEGVIDQIDQSIGMQRAVNRMLWHIEKMKIDPEGKKVRISQCDSKELCTKVAHVMRERFGFQDIKIITGNGLTTTYENPGGIVMAIET